MKLGGAALAAVIAAGAAAAHADELGTARVVFARGTSLWMTDGRGKSAAVEIAALPGAATGVRMIRTDGAGANVLFDHEGHWFWFAVPAAGEAKAEPRALPCGSGPARFSRTARYVLCADEGSQALLVRLSDSKLFPYAVPAMGASLTERDGVRELVWNDGARIAAAPLAYREQTRVLAPVAPMRGFLAAPDGSRGVGVYRDRPLRPRDAPERDQLFGFALDGTAARRRLIRDGVVIDWSWDSHWLLIQDGAKACIARATGGQFKCWKGYTALSLSPDGSWALVVGPRAAGGAAAKDKDKDTADAASSGSGESASGEGGDGDAEDDTADGIALPRGDLSLFRAKLGGPYTERPALVETVIDGAAAWLPPLP